MDPIQMLTEDHRRVEQLFDQFERAGNPQEKQRIAQTVFQELMIHGSLEKDIFYPAVREKGDQQEKELVEHSYHDHAESEQIINELKGMSPSDPQFESKFRELKDAVLDHAKEEEDMMFPDARQQLGEELPRLGSEMQQAKQHLQGRMAA